MLHERFLREAKLSSQLEHPNVVPIHDLVTDERGGPVLVLKRIEGTDWLTWLGRPHTLRERFDVRDPLEWHLRTLMTVAQVLVSTQS